MTDALERSVIHYCLAEATSKREIESKYGAHTWSMCLNVSYR